MSDFNLKLFKVNSDRNSTLTSFSPAFSPVSIITIFSNDTSHFLYSNTLDYLTVMSIKMHLQLSHFILETAYPICIRFFIVLKLKPLLLHWIFLICFIWTLKLWYCDGNIWPIMIDKRNHWGRYNIELVKTVKNAKNPCRDISTWNVAIKWYSEL